MTALLFVLGLVVDMFVSRWDAAVYDLAVARDLGSKLPSQVVSPNSDSGITLLTTSLRA